MTAWVTGPKLEELRGYTAGQRKGRIQRGVWIRGVEYVDNDGTRMFNMEVIDARNDARARSQRTDKCRATTVRLLQ